MGWKDVVMANREMMIAAIDNHRASRDAFRAISSSRYSTSLK